MVSNETSELSKSDLKDWLSVVALFVIVVWSRIANTGVLYFVDGPSIVDSIYRHTYVVQSPGYWAFAHLGALFKNAAFGLAFWNITFSAIGVCVFYLLCRLVQRSRTVCFLSAFAYSAIYFVWFAGEIHSSYASQILFPSLSLYCFFRLRSSERLIWAWGWALASALGMAIRPSDGVFLLPLAVYLLAQHVKDKRAWVLYFAVNVTIFLVWYMPTRHGLALNHRFSTGSTILISMQTVSPLLTGFNERSLANTARVVIPLLIAFWGLVPSIFSARPKAHTTIAVLWGMPGLCFFLLCYMADPTYLVFLSGAVVWLVATSSRTKRSLCCLVVCATFNACLFLYARPITENGLTYRLANFYVVKYCRYGIEHRWSTTVGRGAQVP